MSHERHTKLLILAVVIVAFVLLILFISISLTSQPSQAEVASESVSQPEMAFSSRGLSTNTFLTNVAISEIVSASPGIDTIPAINSPKFISIDEAMTGTPADTLGILVEVEGESRFYPQNILVFHEVVNDVINGKELAITFCPLCGSGVVFERHLEGELLEFGVSGLLYESNLLMFDQLTNSLWQQATGIAIVGDSLGEKLQKYPSQLLSLSQVGENYPSAMVLSRDTGFERNYDFNPYGNYTDDDQRFLFPTGGIDTKLPAKEIIYAVDYEDKFIAFPLEELRAVGNGTLDVNGITLTASVQNGEVSVVPEGETAPLPGYFSMWFSWAGHHPDNALIWSAGN